MEVVSKTNSLLVSPCLYQQQYLCNLRVSSYHNKKWALNFGISSFKLKSLTLGRGIFIDEAKFNSIPKRRPPYAQMKTGIIGKTQKWWEKGLQPNMKEVTSAQDLVDSLTNAGDKLVVVDFFSPGCGGCKALHPKICQLAEMNPEVQFLQVNHEEHKSMAYSLNVHVLPFFRFYRGAHGRLCSFSCTNATIKKFKDALAKHTTERCSLGPTKGLEEKELIALAANKDLSFHYTPKELKEKEAIPISKQEERLAEATSNLDLKSPLPLPLPLASISTRTPQDSKDSLVTSGR